MNYKNLMEEFMKTFNGSSTPKDFNRHMKNAGWTPYGNLMEFCDFLDQRDKEGECEHKLCKITGCDTCHVCLDEEFTPKPPTNVIEKLNWTEKNLSLSRLEGEGGDLTALEAIVDIAEKVDAIIDWINSDVECNIKEKHLHTN